MTPKMQLCGQCHRTSKRRFEDQIQIFDQVPSSLPVAQEQALFQRIEHTTITTIFILHLQLSSIMDTSTWRIHDILAPFRRDDPERQKKFLQKQEEEKCLRFIPLSEILEQDTFPVWDWDMEKNKLLSAEECDHIIFISHRWLANDADAGGELFAKQVREMLSQQGILAPTGDYSLGSNMVSALNQNGVNVPRTNSRPSPEDIERYVARPATLLDGNFVGIGGSGNDTRESNCATGCVRVPLQDQNTGEWLHDTSKVGLFFDNSCLPQRLPHRKRTPEEEEIFQKRLAAMNTAVLLADTVLVIPGEQLHYNESMWCLYEFGGGLLGLKSFQIARRLYLDENAIVIGDGIRKLFYGVRGYFQTLERDLKIHMMETPESQPHMARYYAKCWADEVQCINTTMAIVTLLYFRKTRSFHVKDVPGILEKFHNRLVDIAEDHMGFTPPGLALIRDVHLDSALEKLFKADEHNADTLYAGYEAVIGNPSAEFSRSDLIKEITDFCEEFETGYRLLSKPKEATEGEVESNRVWMKLLLTNIQLWELDHRRPGNGCCTIL